MPYLILTSLIWAFSFPLIKKYLSLYDPSMISFLRLFISFLVFLPLTKFKNLSRKHVVKQMLIGVVQFGVMYVLYIKSYQYLKGHQIALLTITTPVYVVLLDALFNRKWRPVYWSAAFLTLAGSYTLVDKGAGSVFQLKGVLLVQAANGCFALGQILQKKWLHGKLYQIFAWSYLGGLAVPLLTLLLTTQLSPGKIGALLPTKPISLLVLVYLGVVASGLGFYMWNRGVCMSNAGTVSVMNNLKIPMAILVSAVIFGELIKWPSLLIGGSCFCLALYWTWEH
ncbi:MAG: hypothetical protein CSA81_04870 [Acidobacteria bacterium]|nr:MAG: hypothetical protein CSA81_04870 [Acidobacteriota bacterium]PIE91078.1 MAG: hypothetical protein CR997_02865 [Acidobacteriota bacterium]